MASTAANGGGKKGKPRPAAALTLAEKLTGKRSDGISGGSLRSVRTWHIRMPPVKRHRVAGHMLPTFKTATRFVVQRKRRVALEILSTAATEDLGGGGASKKKETARPTLNSSEHLDDHETVLLRIYRRSTGVRGGDDDESLVSRDDEEISLGNIDETLVAQEEGGSEVHWKEHYQYRLEEVKILKLSGKVVEVQIGSGQETVVRDLKFDDAAEAASFQEILNKYVKLEEERAARQISKYHEMSRRNKQSAASGGAAVTGDLAVIDEGEEDDMIRLLVEIVSATDLPVADIASTDAYVVVRMKGEEVHRTDVISKSLDPIWTLKTGSLFLLEKSVSDFFAATGGMTFLIKDYDAVGSNEVLGSVTVRLEELLAGKGERIGYEIQPEGKRASFKKKDKKEGKLYLRYRRASADDIEFMRIFEQYGKSKKGVYNEEVFLPLRPPPSKFLKRQLKRNDNGEWLVRVKPFPDPDRPKEETKWMTEQQMYEEALKPSKRWVEAGSGDLGKVYLEIIGCDDLPNMDSTTLNPRDKTDAFACVVFEDSVVNTDVIGNSLSPRWMPWCHRAFAFNVSHPSSFIFLALFDYDPELSPVQIASRAAADVHDPIGRVLINLSFFRPDTTYLLTYQLYYSELPEERIKSRGTVTIRLRVALDDKRKAIIRTMMPPPPTYISVTRQLDLQVANYTTEGAVDDTPFSMATFAKHIEELESYQNLVDPITEALMTVWLWRGHCKVTVAGKKFTLPVHSVVAYIWGILVTWNFNFFPSFLLFCVGWALLATNEYKRRHPSRWHSCRSYWTMLSVFFLSHVPPEHTPPNDKLDEIEKYNQEVEERRKRLERDKEKTAEYERSIAKLLGSDIKDAEAEDEDIASKKGGLSDKFTVNPLKPVLYPIQQQLKQAVTVLRMATGIVLWEEAYYTFWITTFSFLLSLAVIWVPWAFLMRWLMRVIVWVGLGPWMALVDKKFFRENPDWTEEERDEVIKDRVVTKYKTVLAAASDYQIRKERNVKLKSMKKYMFGKFLLRVPRFNEDLYADVPLPISSAEPYHAKKAAPVHIEEKKYGQTLFGDMIPHREVQGGVGDGKTTSKTRKKRRFPWLKKALDAATDMAVDTEEEHATEQTALLVNGGGKASSQHS